MNGFLDNLYLRVLAADEVRAAVSAVQLYEVTNFFGYHSDFLGRDIVVPAGFVTDFASIPRQVWNIIDPEDPAILMPSVIHDFMYNCAGTLPGGWTYTREQADHTLREAMEACGAGEIRNFVYEAVRIGGDSHWKGIPS